MEIELIDFDGIEPLEMAASCSVLFDQYDELESTSQDDCYENLYPNVA